MSEEQAVLSPPAPVEGNDATASMQEAKTTVQTEVKPLPDSAVQVET